MQTQHPGKIYIPDWTPNLLAGGMCECNFQQDFYPVAMPVDECRSDHPKGIVYLHIESVRILEVGYARNFNIIPAFTGEIGCIEKLGTAVWTNRIVEFPRSVQIITHGHGA